MEGSNVNIGELDQRLDSFTLSSESNVINKQAKNVSFDPKCHEQFEALSSIDSFRKYDECNLDDEEIKYEK